LNKGYLSQYFDGVALKTLSSVEVDGFTSNQHEFNGVAGLRDLLGEPSGKDRYETQFLYLTDYESDPLLEEGFLTWYDARQKARIERGVMRWEYRLYFSENSVLQRASEKDVLVIAKKKDGSMLAIVAEAETTIAKQISWLFGFSEEVHPGFSVREELETEQDRIKFASCLVLENIGINIELSEETYLDSMLDRFGGCFPPTKVFSSYARGTLPEIDVSSKEYDRIIVSWVEREEILFRTLEKHLIAEHLSKGFNGNVDEFTSFSLSVLNRRKSRAGRALENHLEAMFQKCSILYDREATTENKSRPDFIFPDEAAYHDSGFESAMLTMLGVKSTCKDRWRQVLSEADRITHKHLFTLEAAISNNQIGDMQSKNLQLVVPESLHTSYHPSQIDWLLSLSEFIGIVLDKQKNY